MGRPQHPPPLPLSRGTLFPSSHPRSFPRQGSPLAAPDLADVSKSWAYSAGGETERSNEPFYGPWGRGSWELGRKAGKRGTRGGAVAIKTLASEDVP